MQRRKFIAGVGSLAAGAAAVTGTGAFTSVQADRSVQVATTGDASAMLALDTTGAENNSYVSTSGGGEVSVDIDALNVDSTTQINDLFEIRNQGTQAAVVYVDPSSIDSGDRTTTGSGLTIDPQATERPNGDYTNTSGVSGGVEDDQISLTGLYNDPPYDYSAYGGGNDAKEEFVLESGESFEFGLYVNSNGGDGNGNLSDSTEITIVADTTVVPSNYAGKGN